MHIIWLTLCDARVESVLTSTRRTISTIPKQMPQLSGGLQPSCNILIPSYMLRSTCMEH